MVTQTEYWSKLPNITNSIDVINVNSDTITDSLVDRVSLNTIAVIPTDNFKRSFPFNFSIWAKILSYSPVSSSATSQIGFYLTDLIGRPVNLNDADR